MVSRGRVLVYFIVFFSFFSGLCSAEGLTERDSSRESAPTAEAIDLTDRTRVLPPASPVTKGVPAAGRATTDPAWQWLATEAFSERIPVGERFAVRFERSSESLVRETSADPLTATGRAAVDRAPAWLRARLEDQLSRMNAASQDRWAGLITAADDPYVDETAFLIATMSPHDLAHASFDEGLIEEMATYPYEVDPFLDYVALRDVGSAAQGGDYHTALVYQVELDGTVSEVVYPRELYYWYVIHPRGSDEPPLYIDPVPCSSGGTPAAPPTGKFWARWLFYNTDNKFGGLCDNDFNGDRNEPCPLLKDVLAGVPVLWRHNEQGVNGPANGAVGVVNDWVRKSIGPFGDKDGCRPVQPVNVYYHGDGNCGEFADLTMAGGRAALIPTEVTSTGINDHVWNEFYDAQWGRWVQWEPINNMIDGSYSGWWGGKLAATHTDRADGWGHTERTADHGPSATLTVTVRDANHYPIDGAEVLLGSEWDALPFITMEASRTETDAAGQARFTLGDQRNFYIKVRTPFGEYPSGGSWGLVVENTVGGQDYEFSPPDFPGAVPRLAVSAASSSGTDDEYLIEADYAVLEGYTHGTSTHGDIAFTKEYPSDVDSFVVDEGEWSQLLAGSPFEGFELALDDAGRTLSFVPPEFGDYTVVLANEAASDMSQVVSGEIRLYRNTGAVPPVAELRLSRNGDVTTLDWEELSGQNVDGYNVYRSTNPADVGAAAGEGDLAPHLLAHTLDSHYDDEDVTNPGVCFFYSIRTRSARGGISP